MMYFCEEIPWQFVVIYGPSAAATAAHVLRVKDEIEAADLCRRLNEEPTSSTSAAEPAAVAAAATEAAVSRRLQIPDLPGSMSVAGIRRRNLLFYLCLLKSVSQLAQS